MASTVAGILSPRAIGLDLHLAGIADHVRIGKDAAAFDDDAGARHLLRSSLAPGFIGVRAAQGGKHLDDGISRRKRWG